MSRHLLAAATAIALACLADALATAEQARDVPSRYLFTWVGDEDRADSDFLAVVDLDRQGDWYGTIVTTTPVGEKGYGPTTPSTTSTRAGCSSPTASPRIAT